MANDFFRIYKGLELDESSQFLTGSGVPGAGGDTAVAPVGSYYTNTVTGLMYLKDTAGSGTGKWKALATEAYVQAFATQSISWREPVQVRENVATTLPTGTPTATIVVDGVTISDGQLVLFAALTVNPDLYVYNQALGTFSEEVVGGPHAGDATYVLSGTDAGDTYVYNGTTWVLIDQKTVNEDGFIRTFIGKSSSGNVTPNYTSNNIVIDATSLMDAVSALDVETGYHNSFIGKTAGNVTPNYTSNNFVVDTTSLMAAISALDVEIGANVSNGSVILATNKLNANITALDTETGYTLAYIGKLAGNSTPTYSSQHFVTNADTLTVAVGKLDTAVDKLSHISTSSSVTTDTVIDSVAASMVEWDVYIVNASDSTNIYAAKVFAAQNGSTADYTKFAALKIGTTIAGLVVTVDVSAGAVRLHVTSTTAVNVTARRLTAI